MSTEQSDFAGELESVTQQPDKPELPAVPVAVVGPVPVQTVGSRAGVSRSRNVADTDAQGVRMLNADDRRRSAMLISATQDIFVGTDQASVVQGVAALWPKAVPLPVTHGEEIWVRNPTPATTTVVSVLTENWAD